MTKDELIEKCPDEFKEELNNFIDDIYNILSDNLMTFDKINSIRDLHIIGDIYDEILLLKNDLY